MANQLRDSNGNILEEGFYNDAMGVRIMYFTGKYRDGAALFESRDGKVIPIYSNNAEAHFSPFRDPKKYVEDAQKDLDWMKKRLKIK